MCQRFFISDWPMGIAMILTSYSQVSDFSKNEGFKHRHELKGKLAMKNDRNYPGLCQFQFVLFEP